MPGTPTREYAATSSMSKPKAALRPERLKNRRNFLRVARCGNKWVMPGLIVQVDPNRGKKPEDTMRVGFTVSKKVGNAVARNRVRRRLRAAADDVLPTVGRPGRDYVVIGRRAALRRSFADLTEDLKIAVNKSERHRSAET
jgi:ribonuclease P protein component